jgi:tetratricopeptide (TPR) repeat protein
VARARETKSPTILAGCLIVEGFQSFLTRDLEAFRDTARSASETGRAAGNSLMISVGLGFEAWALGMLGKSDEAERRTAESLAEAEKIGGRLVAADWIAAGNAEIALNAGRFGEAALRAQAAIEKARAIGGIFGEGMAQRTWGVALARMDPPQHAPADEHLAAALQLFEGGGCVLEVAHTNLAWGALLRDRGDSAGAAERLALAAGQFKAAGLTKQAREAGVLLREARKMVHAGA